MRNFLKWIKKSITSGAVAAASAGGIVVADLDWPAIIGAFVVNAVAVFFAENGPDPRKVEVNGDSAL